MLIIERKYVTLLVDNSTALCSVNRFVSVFFKF